MSDEVNLSISKIQTSHPEITKDQIEKDFTAYQSNGKMPDYFKDGVVDIEQPKLLQHPTGGPPKLPDISPFLNESAAQVGHFAKGAAQGLEGMITQPPTYGGALGLPFNQPQDTFPVNNGKINLQQPMSDTGMPPENWQASLVNQLRQLPFVSSVESMINPTRPYERAETLGANIAPVAAFKGLSEMTRTPELSELHNDISKKLVNALSPSKNNQNWSPALKGVLESGDLASAIQDAKTINPLNKQPTNEPLDIKSHGDFHNAIGQRLQSFWNDEVKPRLALTKGIDVDKNKVLSEMMGVQQGISAKIEPEAYSRAGGEAANFYKSNKPFNVIEAQERVQDLNRRLDSFFKAPIPISEVEATAPKIASTLAERGALLEQIDNAVQKMSGDKVGDFKKRYGNLKTVEEQAFKAKIASEVRKSPGLSQAITPYMGGKILLGLGAILSSHPGVGAGALGLGTSEAAMRLGGRYFNTPEHNLSEAVDLLKKLPKAQKIPINPTTPVQPQPVQQQTPPKPAPTVLRFNPKTGQAIPSVQPFQPSVAPVNPTNTALRVSPSGEVMFTPKDQEINRLPKVEIYKPPEMQTQLPQGNEPKQLNRGPILAPNAPEQPNVVTPFYEQKQLNLSNVIYPEAPIQRNILNAKPEEPKPKFSNRPSKVEVPTVTKFEEPKLKKGEPKTVDKPEEVEYPKEPKFINEEERLKGKENKPKFIDEVEREKARKKIEELKEKDKKKKSKEN